MENIVNFLSTILQSPYFLFAAVSFSISIKMVYGVRFLYTLLRRDVLIKPLFYLLIAIFSAVLSDFAWLLKLVQTLFLPVPYYTIVFFIRIAWAFLGVQYFSLSLFLQALTRPHFKFSLLHYIGTGISGFFATYYLLLALFRPFNHATEAERLKLVANMANYEFIFMKYFIPAMIYSFAFSGLFIAFRDLRKKSLPKILRKQIQLFALFFIMPYLSTEIILTANFSNIRNMHLVVSCSTLLLAIAIYYCLRNIVKLRFLNATKRVQGTLPTQIMDNFKGILKELSKAQNQQELAHITQAFFKDAFSLPNSAVRLSIRDRYVQDAKVQDRHDQIIERYIENNHAIFYPQNRSPLLIMVRDEIAFNNFYDHSEHDTSNLQLLNQLHIDIFLPVFSNSILVGYITIASTGKDYFNNHEQDAIIAYATYLGNVIHLLHNRNINSLLYKEKKLKDALYTKHQEINHYKESVHNFLRNTKQKSLGIVFYKYGRFSRANSEANDLIPIDPNSQEGHPLSKGLRQVAQYVETFNAPYTKYVHDGTGTILLLSGVPHLKQEQTIITVSYPDISDVISKQMHLLHNPNDWDYLLYLSSTKAGNLINSLIPSDTEILLNTKIAILKAALSKRSILLEAPEQDLLGLVKLIHHISMRETLHNYSPSTPISAREGAATLFGSSTTDPYEPLLQKCHNGTLFIKNVHHLDFALHNYLVEYIRYGWYRMYNMHEKMESNARIVFSTHQKISDLVENGKFSRELYSLLKKETISIPSLSSLPYKEKESLLIGFADQLIRSYASKSLLQLGEKEIQKILKDQPASFAEMKEKVEQLILNKAEGNIALSSNDLLSEVTDPDLMKAARLGKQALKDEHILAMLWDKFQSQNKIALFLGVNRSSVNRRFKMFGIGTHSEGVA